MQRDQTVLNETGIRSLRRKPVFTTDNAENHLVSLAEVLAMYLLVWSPVCWQGLDLSPPPGLSAKANPRSRF